MATLAFLKGNCALRACAKVSPTTGAPRHLVSGGAHVWTARHRRCHRRSYHFHFIMGAALMPWILSYLGANFALIAVVVLLVIALGAIAWFAKNWKVAVAAILLVCAGLGYQQIDKNAYQRRVSEEAAAQVQVLQGRLDTLAAVTAEDAKSAKADSEYIKALETVIGDTPPNATVCLDAETSKRIGDVK